MERDYSAETDTQALLAFAETRWGPQFSEDTLRQAWWCTEEVPIHSLCVTNGQEYYTYPPGVGLVRIELKPNGQIYTAHIEAADAVGGVRQPTRQELIANLCILQKFFL